MLENKFDGIIDQTEKRFDVMLNEQLNLIEQYLNRDRLGKQEQLRIKKQNIVERQRELRSRFELAEQQRKELNKKLSKQISDKEIAIEYDIQLETKNRFESIQHIKQCLQGDFPRLQQMLEKETEEAAVTQSKIEEYVTAKMSKLESALNDQKKIREDSEEHLVQLLKEMMQRIKEQIKAEQKDRE